MTAAHYLAALIAICWAVGVVAEAPLTDQDRQDALVCRTLLWVSASGVVQLAQVVDSAGSVTLDALCLNAVIARRVEPSSDAAPRTGRWIMFTTRLLMGLPHNEAVAARDRPKRSIPTLQHDGPLDLNRSIETTPDDSRPLTVCALHVFVSAEG